MIVYMIVILQQYVLQQNVISLSMIIYQKVVM